ncbi:MAG: hypothetical protein JNK00_13135 [Flavipsychrobacter sp.]|nr:hypothetical protein [Flavipsychrobacter sp.]
MATAIEITRQRIICWLIIVCCTLAVSCKVTLITGYDTYIDETAMKMKRDFNRHYFRLVRTIQDNDPNNQNISHFIAYYDEMELDIMLLQDRSKYLGKKSTMVQQQIANLAEIMYTFRKVHAAGIKDNTGDDKRDMQNAVNSSLNAITELQMALRINGKSK